MGRIGHGYTRIFKDRRIGWRGNLSILSKICVNPCPIRPIYKGGWMEQTILGLDIGGTKTSVLLGRCDIHASEAPAILAKETFPTYAPGDGFAECFERICSGAEAIRRQADEMGTPVNAISVSIGGPLDIERGIILS